MRAGVSCRMFGHVLAIALAAIGMSAAVDAQPFTGRVLLESCRSAHDTPAAEPCAGWSEWVTMSPYFCLPDDLDRAIRDLKEFDGQPTNTIEQKDSQEFLNVLFDRLETSLKDTKRKYLIDSIFGGSLVAQLVCKECGKAKNRLEKILTLSVTIQEVKTLQESLSKLIEGEVVADFQCDGCNKRVDISKRQLLVETPNILIVHLQRLVFNFETF